MHGVDVDGHIHYDFTVRLPVVKDTIDALRLTDEHYGTTEGAAANMYYKVAVMSCAMTALGTVPKDDITPELLLNNLSDDDFDLVDAQIEAIKKKRMSLNPKSADTDSPSLPSENMG
ncbi:hypothetical protein BM640_001253 [Shigella sonnei]|nr:hypothetical protein [Shigella sonnei]EFZ2872829.1 hypothetical protein [Shigella sonnei]EFZ3697893.1 hypothetical protein [Shigella sonnei]